MASAWQSDSPRFLIMLSIYWKSKGTLEPLIHMKGVVVMSGQSTTFEVYSEMRLDAPLIETNDEAFALRVDDSLNALNLIASMGSAETFRSNPLNYDPMAFQEKAESGFRDEDSPIDLLQSHMSQVEADILDLLDLDSADAIPAKRKAIVRLSKITGKAQLIKESKGKVSPELQAINLLGEDLESLYTALRALKITIGSYKIASSIGDKLKNPNLASTLWRMFACRFDDFGILKNYPNNSYEGLTSEAQDLADALLNIQTLFIGKIVGDEAVDPLPMEYYSTFSLLKKHQMGVLASTLGGGVPEGVDPVGAHYAIPAIYSLALCFIVWETQGVDSETQLAGVKRVLGIRVRLDAAIDSLSVSGSASMSSLGVGELTDLFQANSYRYEELRYGLGLILRGSPLTETHISEAKGVFTANNLNIPNTLFGLAFGLTKTLKTLTATNKQRLTQFVDQERWDKALDTLKDGFRVQKDYLSRGFVLDDYILCDVDKKTNYYEWCAEICHTWFKGTKDAPPKASEASWSDERTVAAALYKETRNVVKYIEELWAGASAGKDEKFTLQTWSHLVENERNLYDGSLGSPTVALPPGLILAENNHSFFTYLFPAGQGQLDNPFVLCFLAAVTKRYLYSHEEIMNGPLNKKEPRVKTFAFKAEAMLQTPPQLKKYNPKYYLSTPFNPLCLFVGDSALSGCCVRPWNYGISCAAESFLSPKGRGAFTSNVVAYLENAPNREKKVKLANGFFGVFTQYGIIPNANNTNTSPKEVLESSGIRLKLLQDIGFASNLKLKPLSDGLVLFFQDPDLMADIYKSDQPINSPLRVFDNFENSHSNTTLLVKGDTPLEFEIANNYLLNSENIRQSSIFNKDTKTSPKIFDKAEKVYSFVDAGQMLGGQNFFKPDTQTYFDNSNLSCLSASSLGVVQVQDASALFTDLVVTPTSEEEWGLTEDVIYSTDLSNMELELTYDGKYSITVTFDELRYMFSWAKFDNFVPTSGKVSFVGIGPGFESFIQDDLMYPIWFKDKPLTVAVEGGKDYKVTYKDMLKLRTPAQGFYILP